MKQLDNLETAITYDDIQLIPSYSTVKSRSNVDLSTKFTQNYNIKLPIVGSPMDTICGKEMALKLMKLGGVGVIHRFMSTSEQEKIVRELKGEREDDSIPIACAVGVGMDELSRAQGLLTAGCNVLVIDVAHGHHENVKTMMTYLTNIRKTRKFDIIVGSIATKQSAIDAIEWGANGLRCGLGNGSICSTRIQTGHGVPSITSIVSVVSVAQEHDVPVIADGGIRSSGDISKALGVGADSVMLGSLLSGTTETPGEVIEKNNHLYKRYRGLASLETKIKHNKKQDHIEGISTTVPYKGGVKFVVQRLTDGIQSAFSYSGAHTMKEYQQKAEFHRVTNAGVVEGKPHILNN